MSGTDSLLRKRCWQAGSSESVTIVTLLLPLIALGLNEAISRAAQSSGTTGVRRHTGHVLLRTSHLRRHVSW